MSCCGSAPTPPSTRCWRCCSTARSDRELEAFLIGFAYAITDEVHQAFVTGRHASPFDVAMDAAGLAFGLLLLHAARRSVESQRG